MSSSHQSNPVFPNIFDVVSEFPESWDDSEKGEVLDILEYMDGYYRRYIPPNGVDIVNVGPENKGSKGIYWGRGSNGAAVGNVSMSIEESNKIEITAHELGHDVEDFLLEDFGDSRLEKYLLKEFFADLNALTFLNVEPGERTFQRSLQKESYRESYWKASEAIIPCLRRLEIQNFEQSKDEVENREFEKVHQNLDLNKAPPYLSHDNNLGKDSQMFVDSLLNLDELRSLKENIWYENKLLQENNTKEITDFLVTKKNNDSSKNHFREFIKDNNVEILAEEMKADLRRASNISHNYLKWLENGVTAKDLFEELNHITYGDDYGQYVSLPHELGGKEAEKQYENGVRPADVLYLKDEWQEYLNDRLLATLEEIYKI